MKVVVKRHDPSSPWSYADLDRYQSQLADRVAQGQEGEIILSEVAPVITLGKRATRQDILISDEQLASRGIDVYQSDRGGRATYHGPGQWLLFSVDRLERLTGDPRGVRKVVTNLLEIGQKVGLAYSTVSEIGQDEELGIWDKQGKFGAVGIQIRQGILLHGLSINGYQTPQSFLGIRPCGLEKPVSFLLKEPNDAEFLALGERLVKAALGKYEKILDSVNSPD